MASTTVDYGTLYESLNAPSMTPEEARKCQDWNGMDGAVAWHLIERHAESWSDIRMMMEAWLDANRVQNPPADPHQSTGADRG